MSITLKVTLPTETLEWLQTTNLESIILKGSYARIEEREAARNVCRYVQDAVTSEAYEVVVAKELAVPNSLKASSPTLSEILLRLDRIANETDDEDSEYEKITADEWQVQSASTLSTQVKHEGEETSNPEAATIHECDGQGSKYEADESAADDGEDVVKDEDVPYAVLGWSPGINTKEVEVQSSCDVPELMTVLVEIDGSATCFRVDIHHDETWAGLATLLTRYTKSLEPDTWFQFNGYAFKHNGQSTLKMAGVRNGSIVKAVRVNDSLPEHWVFDHVSLKLLVGEQQSSNRGLPPTGYHMAAHPSTPAATALPPMYEDITIVLRDMMDQNLTLQTNTSETLFDLVVHFEALTNRPGSWLSFYMPNGAAYTSQSYQMGLSLRHLGLHNDSVVLVGHRKSVQR